MPKQLRQPAVRALIWVAPDGQRINVQRMKGLLWRDSMELRRAGFASRRRAERGAGTRVKVMIVDLQVPRKRNRSSLTAYPATLSHERGYCGMPLTTLEVVDTAVKIGLGGFISAVGAYYLAKQAHKQTVSRELLSRKTRMLEEACTDAEKYFAHNVRFLNKVAHLLHDDAHELDAIEAERLLDAATAHSSEAWDDINKALAKLSILGATEAVAKLNYYYDVHRELRKRLAPIMLSTADWESARNELGAAKELFYEAASRYLSDLSRI